MRKILIFLLSLSFLQVEAQRQRTESATHISRTFNDVSLSEALRELNRATKRYEVSFIYNELEDFRVTTDIRHKTVPEAVQQVVGFYPMRIVVGDSLITVECTYKTDYHFTGTVIDEQSRPVAYASIAVLNPADSTVISGGISNEAGHFVIPVTSPREVLLRVSFIGYKTVCRPCNKLNVGTIRLHPDSYTITGVQVKGSRRIIKSQTDRLQYIVAADEFAKGLDAQELMRRVPLLQVNDDGVGIVGKNNTHFLLDGRDLPDDMVKTKLKSLHAEDIERIEVISIPPSKYKAEANAGYVNIVLRRDQTLGVNGSVIGSMVFRDNTSEVLMPSLNYANKRLDLSLWGSLDHTHATNDRWQTATFADHERTSATHIDFSWLWGNIGMLAKYRLSKQWTVGFLGYAMSTASDNNQHNVTEEYNMRTVTNVRSPHDKSYSYSGEAFADWLIGDNGKMMTLTYAYADFPQKQDAHLEARTNEENTFNMQNLGDNRYHIDGLKADLTLPYSWVCIEMGGAYTNIRNRSSLNVFSDATGLWAKDLTQSNQFNYEEQTAAAYLSAQHEFGSKFSIKAGLRMEKTWTKGTQETTGETNRNQYTYLFPTLHIGWKPSDKANIGFAYSKGISRPDFNDLNPFRYYQTPNSYISGNPFLLPGITDNVEVNFTDGRGLYAVLYENHQSDAGGLPTTFLADGTEVNSVANCFTTDKTGLYVSWRRNLFPWWNVMLGGEVFYRQSRVTAPASNLHDEQRWSGKVETSADWFLNHSHTLALNAYYNYFFPQVNFMGRYERSTAYSGLSLRYSLLKDRLRLNINISDPFHQNTSRSISHYNDYSVYYHNDARARSLSLSATYNFGGSKVRRAYRQSKNTDASRATAR